jgi:hypothetical protein
MPTYTDRATRTLKLQKAERPKIGNGLPPMMDGFEGENRIQMVNGNPRLYYRANNSWYFTGLAKDGESPDLPIATSTQLGLIKIGGGGTISSDGTYTATAATPAADDITGGDAASTFSTSSGAVTIGPAGNNEDVYIKGTDDSSTITALTFDMSAAGAATFNNNVIIGALLIMPDVTNHKILVSDGTSYQEVSMSGDATIANTGAITLAAAQTNITSIYATDLIMGEDSQTAIDFGTANEIDFKINNSTELTLDASALYPVTDAGLDLGTSTLEFKDAFFDGTVTSDAFAGPLTGNVTGDVSGNAGTVTVATRSTNATHYLLFSSATSGSLSVYDNASFNLNPSTGALTVPNMTISTGLTVNGLTASDNLDIGTYGFRAAELYADNRTSGRVAFYAANGQLQDDSDLTFATATLTATNIVGSTSIKTPYLDLDRGSTGAGYILFREDSDNGTNYVQVIGPASTANVTLTLPSSAGTIARTADIPDWTASGTGTIHANNYTDTVDMGDGFKIADADSNVDVVEGEYVKFVTETGSAGTAVVTGAGTSGDPHLVTIPSPNTYQATTFQLEDGDGTEVTVAHAKEVKFIDTTGIDINWTDTSTGSDGDPFDLTFTLSGPLQDVAGLSVTNSSFIVGDGSNFVLENAATARASMGVGDSGTHADTFFKEFDDVETVALGGTGATSFTDGGILFGNGGNAIQASAVLAAGEILIGDGTTEPAILDVGSASAITVLGTVGTGTWQGSSIAVGYTDAKCTNANADQTSANTCSRGATLTDEAIQDLVGAMVSDNTETNCTVTYQDSDGTIDFITQDTNTTYTAGTGLDLVSEEFRLDLSDVMTNGANNYVVTATGADAMNAEANLIFDGTNLGIGTTSPQNILDVTTSSNASFPLRIRGDIDNDGGYTGIVFGYEADTTAYSKAAIMVEGTSGNVQPNMYFLIETTGDSSSVGKADAKLAIINSSGNVHADNDIIAYSSTISDVRIKEEITPITDALGIINQIDTIRYKYNYRDGYHYGIKAHQIQELIPEIVKETDLSFHTKSDSTDMKLVVRDKELIPFLIESIKELKQELDALKGIA